jgi:hypothetical protein
MLPETSLIAGRGFGLCGPRRLPGIGQEMIRNDTLLGLPLIPDALGVAMST